MLSHSRGQSVYGLSEYLCGHQVQMCHLYCHLKYRYLLREDTHVRPLRVYPPYTNGLVVHDTFFLQFFFFKFLG